MTSILSFLGSIFIRFLGSTLRIRRINSRPWYKKDGKPNVIYAFWHGEQFVSCYHHSFHNVAIMSSLSKDGEIQAGVLKRLGFQVVRGSSSKGGERALVELIRHAKKGYETAFAVDGPKGPYHEIKPGITYHAYKTGKAIIPLNSTSKKFKVLSKAWDKYELPAPFTSSIVMYGNPIFVKNEVEIQGMAAKLKNALDENTYFLKHYAWSRDVREYIGAHPCPNILIVQPSRLGDVVFALPAVNAIRSRFPKAKIHWLVDERCAPVIEGHSAIDNLLVFDRSKVSAGYLWNFRKLLREYDFDLSIDFHGLFKSALMVGFAGAHFKLASSSTRGMKELSWLFSKEIKAQESMHCVERHMQVAEYLGCDTGSINYNLSIDDISRARVKEILQIENISGKIIAIHPGGGWKARRWPADRYAELIKRLKNSVQCAVVLIGGKEGGSGEGGLNAEIVRKAGVQILDLTDKFSLKELKAFFGFTDLLIANEAGPMHIATAMGIKAIALLGPTDPGRTGPYKGNTTVVRHKVECGPCRNRNCASMECINLITVDEVFHGAIAKLN